VAKAVIDAFKRANTDPNIKTIGPETITNWTASVEADGRVDVHITLYPRRNNPYIIEGDDLNA